MLVVVSGDVHLASRGIIGHEIGHGEFAGRYIREFCRWGLARCVDARYLEHSDFWASKTAGRITMSAMGRNQPARAISGRVGRVGTR